jgi:hypothetical protein
MSFVENQNLIRSHGKTWFYRLKGGEKGQGLLDIMSDEEKALSLIVCFVNAQNIRHYSMFDSFLECVQVMMKIEDEKRCFHELVLENRNQKMRFDLDIKKVDGVDEKEIQDFIDDLLTSTINVYAELGYQLIPSRHILLFSSHGRSKWSYHIIIDGFYCENCQESQALFKKITEQMKYKERASEWLDASIYNPNHSLRILSSVKDGRKKVLEKVWRYANQDVVFEYTQTPRNDKHKIVMEFERSFISLTENCFPIPELVKKTSYDGEEKRVDDHVSDYAFRLFKSMYGDVFAYVKTVSNFILMDRVKESGCPICNRVHENENAFLMVKSKEPENGMTRHEIYFYCRRASGQKVYVGEKIDFEEREEKIVIENKPNARFQLSDLEWVSKMTKSKMLKL